MVRTRARLKLWSYGVSGSIPQATRTFQVGAPLAASRQVCITWWLHILNVLVFGD
jgi:hypothetical protein